MLKKLIQLTALLVSFHSFPVFSADSVINGKVWSVEYNTASAFYSAAKGEEEITLECLLGDISFSVNNDENGVDFNSHDDKVQVVIDDIVYKAPTTPQERKTFYERVIHAKDSIALREVSGESSKSYPIKELAQFFSSIEYDLSDCKE